jgi:hypothetical protein
MDVFASGFSGHGSRRAKLIEMSPEERQDYPNSCLSCRLVGTATLVAISGYLLFQRNSAVPRQKWIFSLASALVLGLAAYRALNLEMINNSCSKLT